MDLTEEGTNTNSLLRKYTGVDYSSQSVRVRVQQSVNAKLAKIEEVYSKVFKQIKNTQNDHLIEEITQITSLIENKVQISNIYRISEK